MYVLILIEYPCLHTGWLDQSKTLAPLGTLTMHDDLIILMYYDFMNGKIIQGIKSNDKKVVNY